MRERLLITGGSGFVAYHIICEAIKQNFEVFVSIRSSSDVSHLKDLDIKYTSLDFADIPSIKKQLEENKYHYIIHSAGLTRATKQEDYNRVNAAFSANLAHAASVANIPLKKFVFVSSLASVGPALNAGVIDENSKHLPVTGYGKSKLLAEQMLQSFKGLPLLVFRPTAVYGPRDKDILIILKTIIRGFEPYIGNKPQQLSFIYVKDLAKLIVDSLAAAVVGKAYNISDGKIYDRFALAGITKKITGKTTFKFHLPLPIVKLIAGILEAASSFSGKTPALNREKINELTASWGCNIEAAKKDLHFNPVYDLETGLKETLDWYKTYRWI